MERHLDADLRILKQMILTMGEQVERAIEEATRALLERRSERFARVHEIETVINVAHKDVDEACLKLLARQSPLATDLRFIVATIKINSDLERMGDQAVNIAENGRRYLEEAPLKPLIDIPQMAEEVRVMVRRSLEAFVGRDLELAYDVLERDDSVDALKNRVFRELVAEMLVDSRSIERAMNLILIARNLERIGDHATNVAEDVIFAINGLDVRHGARQPRSPKTPHV